MPPVKCGVKVNYNKITNKYTLLFPIKIEPIINENKSNNAVYLDPGLRTFMTGISENINLTIGNNVNSSRNSCNFNEVFCLEIFKRSFSSFDFANSCNKDFLSSEEDN